MALATKRAGKEFSKIQGNLPNGVVSVDMVDENILHWSVKLTGFDGTPYKTTGAFDLRINLSENYPNEAPKLRFATSIFHPNIEPLASGGRLCEGLLADWAPTMTIADTVIPAVQSLFLDLDSHNKHGSLNDEATRLYAEDKNGFFEKVKAEVSKHAQ